MDEELHRALETEAARRGTSKAALVRLFVAYGLRVSSNRDPLDDLVGAYEEKPDRIDVAVYEA